VLIVCAPTREVPWNSACVPADPEACFAWHWGSCLAEASCRLAAPSAIVLPLLLVSPSISSVTPCVRSTHPHILIGLCQAVAEDLDAPAAGLQHHLALAAAQLLHVQRLRW
jgi:hypothetical protein